MMIALCSLITIKYPNWNSFGQKLDTVIAYSMAFTISIFLAGSTILMIVQYKKQEDIIQNEEDPKGKSLT
jgi:hypothetical protein